MENEYKYLVYFEGRPVYFNIKTAKIVTYRDIFSFKDKENNTREVKEYIKEWAMHK